MAACRAGLALLSLWSQDVRRLPENVHAEHPLLVIDQSWVDGLSDAPPPHVVLTLMTKPITDRAPVIKWHDVGPDLFPLHGLLVGQFAGIQVPKVPAAEHGEDSGAWILRFPPV